MEKTWLKIDLNNTIAKGDEERLTPAYCKDNKIVTTLLPEPYTGWRNSRVVCLNGNPGYSDCDEAFRDHPLLREKMLATLRHDSTQIFWLEDEIRCPAGGLHPGCRWWRQKTQPLQDALGEAPRMFVLEFFPYHSRRGFSYPLDLPSYGYRNHLLREAMDAGKLIVVMRAKRWWEGIEEDGLGERLKEYRNKIELASPQNVVFSPKNVGEKWDLLIDELKRQQQ